MDYIFFFIGSKLAQIWPISGSQFAANLFRLSTNRPQHEQVLVQLGRKKSGKSANFDWSIKKKINNLKMDFSFL